MKVISLLQPWATLVVTGVKQIETRSWSSAYRGPLLIHASKGRAGKRLACEPVFKDYIADFRQLSFGYIIGEVTLTDIIRIDSADFFYTKDEKRNILSKNEKAFGDYTTSRFAWILQDPVIFKKPVKAKGSLSLWVFDEKLIDESRIYKNQQ